MPFNQLLKDLKKKELTPDFQEKVAVVLNGPLKNHMMKKLVDDGNYDKLVEVLKFVEERSKGFKKIDVVEGLIFSENIHGTFRKEKNRPYFEIINSVFNITEDNKELMMVYLSKYYKQLAIYDFLKERQ